MDNTFDPELKHTLNALLRPQAQAVKAQRPAPARHPQVIKIVDRVISVDFKAR